MDHHDHDCCCGHDHDHDHDCDCGCEYDDYEPITINTVTDTGEELSFKVLEVFEFEGKSYARLQSCDEDQDEDEDLLMECEEVGDEYVFRAIEDNDLFDRIVEFLDEGMDEDEDEDDGDGGCECGCHCHHD